MNKKLLALVLILQQLAIVGPATAAPTPIAGQEFTVPTQLVNPGFENGAYGWTASGGATKTANSTAKYVGSYGYDWDSNSAAQTLTSTAITVAQADNYTFSCQIKVPSGTSTYKIQIYDGSSALSETIVANGSSTAFNRYSVTAVAAAGSLYARVISVASNEPEIYIDACYFGKSEGFNTATVSTVTDPTITYLTSGTAATYTTPVGATYLKVELVGGGGGGGGSSTNGGGAGNGGNGGQTTFGISAGTGSTDLVSGGGGAGGQGLGGSAGSGGTGTINLPAYGFTQAGGKGGASGGGVATANTQASGGDGGVSCFGGNGSGGQNSAATGIAAQTNSGSGGGGGGYSTGGTTLGYAGAGGSAGGCAFAIVPNPAASYTYTIGSAGSAGTAGTSGTTGGAGGTGAIRVTAYYEQINRTLYTPDTNVAYWGGYHSSDCSWTRSSTSFGDPGVDSSCTFGEFTNKNFGTVSSYTSGSDKLPGITFTPPRTGTLFVCAVGKGYITSASPSVGGAYELSDGTTSFAGAQHYLNTTTNAGSGFTLCSMVPVTSATSKTLRIRTESDSGSILIGRASGGDTSPTVSWSMAYIDASFNAPLLMGSVTSNTSGIERIERATITYSGGAPSVTSQSGSWVTSVTDSSTGQGIVNFAAGIFSAAPTCVCSSKDNGTRETFCAAVSVNANNFTYKIADPTNNNGADSIAYVICMGPR
jgi:hypothetical protein